MLDELTGLAVVSVGVGRLAVELERGERTLICDLATIVVVCGKPLDYDYSSVSSAAQTITGLE